MSDHLFTFSGSLSYVAKKCPERWAVSVRGGEKLVYTELSHLVEKAASRLLSLGVKPGDAVTLIFSDNIECIVWLLAVMRIRALAVVSLEALDTVDCYEHYVHSHNARLVVGGPESDLKAKAAADGAGAVYLVVSVSDLAPDVASAPGAVDHVGISDIVNEPSDPALLLVSSAGDDANYDPLTQRDLASLLLVTPAASQPTSSHPAVPHLLSLRGHHQHFASIVSSLAAAAKSIANAAEGVTEESGRLAPSNTAEYRRRFPELCVVSASILLIFLIDSYLPAIPPAPVKMAAVHFFLALNLSIAGLALKHWRSNRDGGSIGAAGLALCLLGVAVMLLPALGLWHILVAAAASLVLAAIWVRDMS